MKDDLHELRQRLKAYLDDDSLSIADAATASILARVELRLRGQEPQTSLDLATLLAQVHLARYQILPESEDQPALTAAIRWYRRVLRAEPERVPSELRDLFHSGAFGPDEAEFGDPDLLADCQIDADVRRLECLCRDGNPRWQATMAAFLATRYERAGREEDLDRAIEMGRAVLRHANASPSESRAARSNLAGALLNRFARFTDSDALDEAIQLYGQALAERGSAADHANLGMAYLTRYETTAELPDLEAAERYAREAVQLTAELDPSRSSRLSNLAAAVRALYDETDHDAHLDEAVTLAELALDLSSPGDPARVRRLSNLCSVLSTRFEKRAAGRDIDRAVQVGRESVASGPHTGAIGRLSNLLLALHLRGAASGNVEDLQEALRLGRAAAVSLPEDHADRPDILSNAAGAAMSWFDWTGDITAITEAVDLSREAVHTLGDSGRAGLLHTNLSMHLLTRFEVTGDAADVEEAVRHAEAGADVVRGPAAAIAFSNLAVALRTRYEIAGASSDLERAVSAARAAVGSSPQHRDRPAFESNLALCLWLAGDRSGALEYARTALENPLTSGTPSRAAYAANVARMLTALGGPRDEIDTLWASVGGDPAAPVPLRIEAFSARADLPGAAPRAMADDLTQAVALVPAAAWHGIGVPSRLRRLADWQGIGRDAAAAVLAVDGPEHALRLLEAADSQLWARKVPSSGEESLLRHAHPELAEKIGQLREALSR